MDVVIHPRALLFPIHGTPKGPEVPKQNEPQGPAPRRPAPRGPAPSGLRPSGICRAQTSRELRAGSNPRPSTAHGSGRRMRSSSTARLAAKMEYPAPDAPVAADPGGAGPYKIPEEPEGREPDGVRFDRERARRLWEAASGAQPAGREEGESSRGLRGWRLDRGGMACRLSLRWPREGCRTSELDTLRSFSVLLSRALTREQFPHPDSRSVLVESGRTFPV